jgi:hypothetical protein
MTEYGIFNDESASYASKDAVEDGFYSIEEAQKAIDERYSDDDQLEIHAIEEEEEEEEEDEDGRD